MSALPAVRGLTDELAAENVDALLVNIHTEVGQTLTERFAFEFSPTYLLFAPGGGELWRSNTTPSLAELRAALAGSS